MSEKPKGPMEEITAIDTAYCSNEMTLEEARNKLTLLMDVLGVEFVIDSISPTLKSKFLSKKARVPIH